LLISTRHKDDSTEVTDKQDFKGLSPIVNCLDSKRFGMIFVKCFKQVFETSWEAPLSEEKVVDICEEHTDFEWICQGFSVKVDLL